MKYNNGISKQKVFITYHIFISLLILLPVSSIAQTLTVGGNNWTPTIPPITEAGTDYAGTYESATNQILLNASVPLLLGNAKVSVRYQANPLWNTAMTLNIRRTGNGTTVCVLCTITGGTTYQALTLVDVELFRIGAVLALANYNNIPIQLQLTGVSVTIPTATYNSRVVFTIGPL